MSKCAWRVFTYLVEVGTTTRIAQKGGNLQSYRAMSMITPNSLELHIQGVAHPAYMRECDVGSHDVNFTLAIDHTLDNGTPVDYNIGTCFPLANEAIRESVDENGYSKIACKGWLGVGYSNLSFEMTIIFRITPKYTALHEAVFNIPICQYQELSDLTRAKGINNIADLMDADCRAIRLKAHKVC